LAGLELTVALTRLLSDCALRRRFAADRAQVAVELGLRSDDAAILAGIDPSTLDRQARSLVGKRRSEVARIAPRTWNLLGATGREIFTEYASEHWPEGHRRHPHDALAFLRFLSARGLPYDAVEKLRIETRLSFRRWRLQIVRGGAWRLPGIYCGWRTRHGWKERLVHLGPFDSCKE
jgi:hypothetical protein